MTKKRNLVHRAWAGIPIAGELIILSVSCVLVFVIAGRLDILERFVDLSRRHESWELDELLIVSVFLVFALAIFAVRRLRESRSTQISLERQNVKLEEALVEINQLRGIIPICAECKKIRDDAGAWHQIEAYIGKHSEAKFSHGVCPECVKSLYPEFSTRDNPDRTEGSE
ncbi:MAG: hypothetical protein GY835_15605 [bacterium]|nr:hypothetical protein [bacterium]